MKHFIYLVDLIFNSHIIKSHLEFWEFDSVVEINIKISICFWNALVLLLDFNPKEIKHSHDEASLGLFE
jgi:hypothetical protein